MENKNNNSKIHRRDGNVTDYMRSIQENIGDKLVNLEKNIVHSDSSKQYSNNVTEKEITEYSRIMKGFEEKIERHQNNPTKLAHFKNERENYQNKFMNEYR